MKKCYCSYDYEKIYSVLSRVFMCKEPPDLDLILLFVIAANVENRQYEINFKKEEEEEEANVRPISSSICVQDIT